MIIEYEIQGQVKGSCVVFHRPISGRDYGLQVYVLVSEIIPRLRAFGQFVSCAAALHPIHN